MKQNENVKKESGAKVLILGNKCYRCGHEWIPENLYKPPKVCPKCKNPYWDRPKQKKEIHKKNTETSSFGTSGRFGHDSSKFYSRKLYSGKGDGVIETVSENELSKDVIDKILCKSSESMNELPDNSIHLMITSPPYNVGKDYDENLSLEKYRELLRNVFKEAYRVLVVGGRACINIANIGRKPYIPLHSFIIEDMLKIGFFMRGEIIWNKAASAGQSMAWGSWLSASNPSLRDVHEYILIFSKGNNGRENNKDKKSTITKDEFMEFTKSVWTFPAQSARAIGHPAPFPLELPLRLIKLYTFAEDIVLDPFMGSGTAAVASIMTGRHFVGYDTEKKYVKSAQQRINEELYKKQKLTKFIK